MTRALLFGSGSLLALATPAVAQQARVAAVPYIELSQTVDVDLKSGDAVTYTSAAAGINASIDTASTSAQASARAFGPSRARCRKVGIPCFLGVLAPSMVNSPCSVPGHHEGMGNRQQRTA